jgi:cytochrome c peroxidase
MPSRYAPTSPRPKPQLCLGPVHPWGIVTLTGLLVFGQLMPLAAHAAEPVAKPEPLAPLPSEVPSPDDNPPTPEKIELGRQLFFDPRLSGNGMMSCGSCHLPEKGWGDGLARAEGHEGKQLERNTPTLLNVAFHSSLFWDGQASSLEEQALGPIESPDEMNQDLDQLERKLNAIPGYVEQFQKVFGTEVTRSGVAQALAAFQRTLVTGPAPLDRYLAGEKDALSAEARRGLELFIGDAGCIRCHNGPLLSDGKFYRIGVSFSDKGRMAVTNDPADRAKFRTPSLRNVAETGPYMHNGSRRTLPQVVEFYLRDVPTTAPDGLELDIEPLSGLSYSDNAALVAFLRSLSGEVPQVAVPELP